MKALYATSPGDYGLTTQAVPEPRADEALVRVSAAAICPNEDRLRRGTLTTVTWPVIPGHQRTLILAGTGGRRLALAETLGADATVNLGADDAGRRLHDLLDGHGADAAILCGPSADDLAVAADLVAPRGRIVVDGHVDPRASLRLPPVGWLVARDATVTANRGFVTPDYNAAHRLVQDGRLQVETLVTCRFPLDDWAEAFEAFVDPERQSVQVLMEP